MKAILGILRILLYTYIWMILDELNIYTLIQSMFSNVPGTNGDSRIEFHTILTSPISSNTIAVDSKFGALVKGRYGVKAISTLWIKTKRFSSWWLNHPI